MAWMVLIFLIKGWLFTSWKENHLVGVITWDYSSIILVNSHVVYKALYPKDMELLDFKIVIMKSLIGAYNNRCWNTSVTHTSLLEVLPASVPLHLPVIQTTIGKYRYCYNAGIENKTYMQCNTCGVFLCFVSGNSSKNCFANFHTQV